MIYAFFIITNVLCEKLVGGKNVITQQEVREKLIKRVEREKQSYIAKQIGMPKQVLSSFKLGHKDLWEEHLIKLNDYLDNH